MESPPLDETRRSPQVHRRKLWPRSVTRLPNVQVHIERGLIAATVHLMSTRVAGIERGTEFRHSTKVGVNTVTEEEDPGEHDANSRDF